MHSNISLQWNPEEYGGIKYVRIPSDRIWLPDIVLYNTAVGNFQGWFENLIITILTVKLARENTKAIIWHDGRISWMPPAIFKDRIKKFEIFQKKILKYQKFFIILRNVLKKNPNLSRPVRST